MGGDGECNLPSQTHERAVTLASLSLSANGLFNPFYGHTLVGAGPQQDEGNRRGETQERRSHSGSRRRLNDDRSLSNGRKARHDAADDVNTWLSQRQHHSGRTGHVITAGLGGSWDAGRAFKDALRRATFITPLGYRGHGSQASDNPPSSEPPPESGESGGSEGEKPADQAPSSEPPAAAADPDRQKRVLIMMSDTGGGHRASAEAIKATFELEFGNKYQVTIIDMWKEHTPWPFNQMPRTYNGLVKYEMLWKLTYHTTAPKAVHQPWMATLSAFVAREVWKGLDRYQPDVIVSVHPLMQHIPLRVLRKRGLLHKIPFTTVVTDLTSCHPTWFHKLTTVCFCPTKEAARNALKAGLQPPQIRIHGLPIRPAFSRPMPPKPELRESLGMDTQLPAVLLMGGGEGMGPVETTARALAKVLAPAANMGAPVGQLVVVCGRNRKLLSKLEAMGWPMPTLIMGFATNMPEIMAACDCIITKAGPGTIAESMIQGLPVILNDFIPGQEVGNVPFVVNNGFGAYEEEPSKIAQIVSSWLGPKADEFREMSLKARKLAHPEAVFKIVRDLDALTLWPHTLDNVNFTL